MWVPQMVSLSQIRSLFSKPGRSRSRKRRPRTCDAAVESLETRQLLTAVELTGTELAISTLASVNDGNTHLREFDIAYNPRANNYLMVYTSADPDFEETELGEREIYGQLLGPAGEIYRKFRISDVSGLYNTDGRPFAPKVAWDSHDNQYLVVWRAHDNEAAGLVDNETEIFGQFLNAVGNEIGQNDFRISSAGGLGDRDTFVGSPHVTYNQKSDEFLVVFPATSRVTTPSQTELYSRIVDDNGPRGTVDTQVTNFNGDLPAESETGWFLTDLDLAANKHTGEYVTAFSAWEFTPDITLPSDVYVQSMDAVGAPTNETQRLSTLDADQTTEGSPAIEFNASESQYFASWTRNVPSDSDEKSDVMSRILDESLEPVTVDPIQISAVNSTLETNGSANQPDIVWNSEANEYLVVWAADDEDGPDPALTVEVFAQRIAPDGRKIGAYDLRVSRSDLYESRMPQVVWNARSNEYFVAWRSRPDNSTATQMLGQRLAIHKPIHYSIEHEFNVDIIADGTVTDFDNDQDAVGLTGHVFVTDALAKSSSVNGNGLPDDGVFPPVANLPEIHLEYPTQGDGANAILLREGGGGLSVDPRNSSLDSLHVIGFAPTSGVELTVNLEFADGGFGVGTYSADRIWTAEYADNLNQTTLINDLDWVRDDGSGFEDINDLALFSYRIPVNENRTTQEIFLSSVGGPQYILGVTGIGYEQEVITVTTAEDENDGDWSPEDLSLREALLMARRHEEIANTIVFDEALYDSVISLDLGPIHTRGSFTISGPGADRLTIDANGQSQIFSITDSQLFGTSRVEIKGLTLANASFRSTNDDTAGAAIYARDIELELDEVAIRNSVANIGGAVASSGELTVRNSEFSGNAATTNGTATEGDPRGGAIISYGDTQIENSTFSNNRSDGSGGAIHVAGGQAVIVNTTITTNHADNANRANSFAKNIGIGGGVSIASGAEALFFNNVIADNFNGSEGLELLDDVKGNVAPNSSHNAVGTVRGAGNDFDPSLSNLRGGLNDPLVVALAPLADNGGPTLTHAILPGSPLVNVGDSSYVTSNTDQRGSLYRRQFDGIVDIGAFEFQPEPLEITFSNPTATEGGVLEFEAVLNRSIEPGEEFFQPIEIQSSSAAADDYVVTATSVQFEVGDQTKTIRVNVVDDGLVEGTEQLNVRWLPSTIPVRFINPDVTGTILDNDRAVFAIDDVNVNESDGNATFVVSLSNPMDIEMTVHADYTDGSATGSPNGTGADYDNTRDTITFPAGDAESKLITVAITDDDIVEGVDDFVANLSTAIDFGDRAVDLTDSAIARITDNDQSDVTFDIDGDGSVRPLTDGILAIRYLAGFAGDALTTNVLSPTATRTSPGEITDYLFSLGDALDIDGDGAQLPLTDGILLLRALAGFTGASLTNGAVSPDATRPTDQQILDHVESYIPPVTSAFLPAKTENLLDELFAVPELFPH